MSDLSEMFCFQTRDDFVWEVCVLKFPISNRQERGLHLNYMKKYVKIRSMVSVVQCIPL